MKKKSYLYILTLAYFLLAFVHIGFSMAAFFCIILPFALLFRNRKRTWCERICPRADYFNKLGPLSLKRKMPRWISSDKARKALLSYFCLNGMLIMMSTFSVATGHMEAMGFVRFMILFPLGPLPQLLDLPTLPPALLHLSYRLFSLMFSSALLGSLMAIFYRPRSWCTVCPINSMSRTALDRLKTSTFIPET